MHNRRWRRRSEESKDNRDIKKGSIKNHVKEGLLLMGFTSYYIERSLKVYENKYGYNYNVGVLTDIIVALQNQDQQKQAMISNNTIQSFNESIYSQYETDINTNTPIYSNKITKQEINSLETIIETQDESLDCNSVHDKATSIIVSILTECGTLEKTKLHKKIKEDNNGTHWKNSFQQYLGTLRSFIESNHHFTIIYRNNQPKSKFKVTLFDSNNDINSEHKLSCDDISQNEEIHNPYMIGDKLEVYITQQNKWLSCVIIEKKDYWIVVHYDGYSSKHDEQIHITQHSYRLRERDIQHTDSYSKEDDMDMISELGTRKQNMINILQASLMVEDEYIKRAFKIYEYNYGSEKYDIKILKDIIVKLEYHMNEYDINNNEIISNKYLIGDKLQIHNIENGQWNLVTVILTEHNWIVVYFDGSSKNVTDHNVIHVIKDKHRIKLPPEWLNNVIYEVKLQNCIVEEIYYDKAIYACFANEIYKNIKFIQEIQQECKKYIDNNNNVFDRLVGEKKIIYALAELFNVNITVFEYDEYCKQLYTFLDFDGGQGIPSVLLAKYGLQYAVIRNLNRLFERPLRSAKYRENIRIRNGESVLCLRDLRISKLLKIDETDVINEKYEELCQQHECTKQLLDIETSAKNILNNQLNEVQKKYEIDNERMSMKINEYETEIIQLNGNIDEYKDNIDKYEDINHKLNRELEFLNGNSRKYDTLEIKELNELELKLHKAMNKIQKTRVRLIEHKFNCIVCLDKPKNILIEGCNHVVLCDHCEKKLNAKVCPMCQAPYRCVKKIHI
eukprot:306867_1